MNLLNNGLNAAGTALAVGGGALVALSEGVPRMALEALPPLAQTPVPIGLPLPGQMTTIGLLISLIGFLTAGLPHAYNSLKLLLEDRRDRRATEAASKAAELAAKAAELAADRKYVDLANALQEANQLIASYQRQVELAGDLRVLVEVSTARHQEGVQALADARGRIAALERILDATNTAVADNQGDLRELDEAFEQGRSPKLAATLNPAPIPPPIAEPGNAREEKFPPPPEPHAPHEPTRPDPPEGP